MTAKTVFLGVCLSLATVFAAASPAPAQFRSGSQPAVQPVTPIIVPGPRFNTQPVNPYPPNSGYIPYVGYYLPTQAAPRSRNAFYIPPWSAETETVPSPERKFVPKPDDGAWVTVRLPADAGLWFDGTKVAATGAVRKFRTPVLKQGHLYTYQVRATWGPAGRPVTQTQPVVVSAGADVRLDFTPPAEKAP